MSFLTDEAKRLIRLEGYLRRAGIPKSGPAGSSPSTFKRDLTKLRAEMGAVIQWRGDHYSLINREWPGVVPHVLAELKRVG